MIVSIMRPPYTITENIVKLVAAISHQLGEVQGASLHKPKTELRKRNRIKTIQSSLEIEGNTMTEEQITALLENKLVIAPAKDILEVQNALALYGQIREFNPFKVTDLNKAHAVLMKGLVDKPGKFRSKNVGIVKGSKVEHLAPSGDMVNGLMNDLFDYLKKDSDLLLIKSCVFHYEFEFIHPYLDGNGRMGRFWQTVVLLKEYPVFEFLPVESLIKQRQKEYYKALSISDKSGHSTAFIEFMLQVMTDALADALKTGNRSVTAQERLEMFRDIIGDRDFSRKEYMVNFRDISMATASRDLKKGTDDGLLERVGDKIKTVYRYI
ncbi:Fic family protein [Flavobacterium sp. MFBS3-15]|uniref:Fic family protein n=1 Tax=Flavobacterium sp. MFBS3-15 TaxID=2989816 RepID=UPI0022360B38|nr:Fic family protein [Flavobacterium sp. MFBS3-15]MCW4467449.1 Fic family protein [Flavobacterium sp. MFBS3-15]